jgi:hypothetical protein
MSRRTGPAIDMRSAEGKAGLTMRLAERRRLFLPLYRLPQIKDVKR